MKIKIKAILLIFMSLIIASMSVVGAFSLSLSSPWIQKDAPTDHLYSFVLVGDTQMLTLNDSKYNTNYLSHIYDWIVNNKEERKIEYVFGLGDITDKNSDSEWDIAKTQINKLNGVVPYSLVRGNHDGSASFNKNFNNDTYRSQFQGFYDNTINNSYRKFSVGGDDYLFINLDYGANDAILKWASNIISRNPDRRVIISTHAYLFSTGSALDDVTSSFATPMDNTGKDMWDKLISKYENIFMVISGHVGVDGPVINVRRAKNNNHVIQVLVDPQNADENNIAHGGFVSIVNFYEDETKLTFEYYSTIKKAYYKESNQFKLTIPAKRAKTTAEATTAATEATETAAVEFTEAVTAEAEESRGCSSAISFALVTLPAVCAGLAAFTQRKRERE